LSGAPPGASDTLALIVAGQTWTGWQRVQVTRSMDMMPASFLIQVTEKHPLGADMAFQPGQNCQVMIGSDLVITGYIDRYVAEISADNHTVMISGRSLSEDLVDCGAFISGGTGFTDDSSESFQVLGGTALSIAQQLAQPYGVTINSNAAGASTQIPQFNINFGETPWEIIDRICRYSNLIAYDLTDGSVILADSSSPGAMASGFVQGQNIEQATVAYSMDQRFQQYDAHILSSAAFLDQQGLQATTSGTATDGGVPRFRKRFIVSEQTIRGINIAQARATWECNRRKARSQSVIVRCDAWRDQAGTLWDLNMSAPLVLRAIKITSSTTDPFLIAAVTFMRDETGQHALVTLMPQGAFAPEPIGDLALPPLAGDLQQNNPTATANPVYSPPTPSVPSGF
jgi:prophage tail gpP-like protein